MQADLIQPAVLPLPVPHAYARFGQVKSTITKAVVVAQAMDAPIVLNARQICVLTGLDFLSILEICNGQRGTRMVEADII